MGHYSHHDDKTHSYNVVLQNLLLDARTLEQNTKHSAADVCFTSRRWLTLIRDLYKPIYL